MIRLRMQTGYAEVCDRGAHLSALFMDNKEILKGSGDGVATHGGSAVLIPYAGRVRGGRYSFNGRNYSLPVNSEGHAIHGLVLGSKWMAVSVSGASAIMTTQLKHDGYPSPLELSVKYSFLSPTSFGVEFEATNAGLRDAPIVVGAHPYFFAKKWSLRHETGIQRLLTEDTHFPNGEFEDFSFNGKRFTNEQLFDDCFVGGGGLTLVADGYSLRITRFNMPYFVVYNGEYAEKVSVSIEPLSGAPDAFNNRIGLKILEPQETFRCGFELSLQI
jgi:aldose 1-epimerase